MKFLLRLMKSQPILKNYLRTQNIVPSSLNDLVWVFIFFKTEFREPLTNSLRRLSESSDNDEANTILEGAIFLSDDNEIRAVIFALGSKVMKSIGQKVAKKFQNLVTLENLCKAVQFVWQIALQCWKILNPLNHRKKNILVRNELKII